MVNTTLERREAWLALQDEIERVTYLWQRLETMLMAADVGYDACDPYATEHPYAVEMETLATSLHELDDRSQQLLDAIPRGDPTNREAAAAKLRVASRLIYEFEQPSCTR